jgi:hypothetical protein
MTVAFAASHPVRVSALVLYGGMARTLWAPDYQFGVPERTYRRGLQEGVEAFMTPGGLEALLRIAFSAADEGRSGRGHASSATAPARRPGRRWTG